MCNCARKSMMAFAIASELHTRSISNIWNIWNIQNIGTRHLKLFHTKYEFIHLNVLDCESDCRHNAFLVVALQTTHNVANLLASVCVCVCRLGRREGEYYGIAK